MRVPTGVKMDKDLFDLLELPILDSHQHFFDARLLRYPVFLNRSAGFEALVGDYGSMPRVYLPQDYARDTAGLAVAKTVWAEFISDDPVGEVAWAQELVRNTGRPNGLIGVVDFLSPDLERTLDAYRPATHLRCVRQHAGWHPTNSLLRFAQGPDLLSNSVWRRGLASLRHRGLVCELEVFAPQLTEFSSVAASFPDIDFILPVMGWPLDLTAEGRAAWRTGLATVARHPNVAIKIFGLECIFGIRWTVAQVRPWILDAIEVFSPNRCMFASHMPICKLACSFQDLYGAYFSIIRDLSDTEQHRLFHDTAAEIYRM
jgi:predicted TIM-barrel fold metal-dependent hydrolase